MRTKNKLLAKKRLEDLALKKAIDKTKTGKFISTMKFLESLGK